MPAVRTCKRVYGTISTIPKSRKHSSPHAMTRKSAAFIVCYSVSDDNPVDSSLRKLADVGERKLENLKRWDKDTYDAVLWLRQAENREKFKAPIIEPPCLCLSVTDKRFTNAIEACFNANQLKVLVSSAIHQVQCLLRCASRCSWLRIRKITIHSIVFSMTRKDKFSGRVRESTRGFARRDPLLAHP